MSVLQSRTSEATIEDTIRHLQHAIENLPGTARVYNLDPGDVAYLRNHLQEEIDGLKRLPLDTQYGEFLKLGWEKADERLRYMEEGSRRSKEG